MNELMRSRIRGLREDSDLKQSDVAKYIHCSQNTYSDYENGKLDISTDTLVMLSELYNISVDYILGLTDEKKPYPRRKK